MKTQFFLVLFLSFLVCISSESFSSKIKKQREEIKLALSACIQQNGSETLKKIYGKLKGKSLSYILKEGLKNIDEEDKKQFEECKKAGTTLFKKKISSLSKKINGVTK